MAKQTHEFKGKTIDDAVDEGLRTLALAKHEVDIEIVQKGSRGIFGLGSEPAIVRLTPRTVTVATPTVFPTPIDVAPPVAPSPAVESSTVEPPAVEVAPHAAAAGSVEIRVSPPVAEPIAEIAVTAEPTPVPTVEDEVASELPVTEASMDEAKADQAMLEMASDLLRQMVRLMGFEAEIWASWQEENENSADEHDEDEDEEGHLRSGRYLLLDIEGTELGALIGRRGETLENMQYLLRLMVNQKIHKWKNIVIDVEHYKARRVTQLTQLAERMAEQVARTGRPISLEPMPANERRIVHMTLREHPEVYTESYGDGARRKVHIFART